MKAFLVAVALLFSSACFASPPPTAAPIAAPGHANPLDDIIKSMLSGEDAPKPVPKFVCKSHPCVPAYRFSGQVNADSAEAFAAFMAGATEAHPDAVMVEINTLGGSMYAGHEISRQMEHAPFRVICVVDGDAVSAGMYILASCDVRVMTKRSELMIHAVALHSDGEERVINVTVENQAQMIKVATRAYVEWCAHRMKGITVAEILAKIDNGHEWWMGWEEGLKYGAIDEVINVPPDEYLAFLRKPVPAHVATPAGRSYARPAAK